MLEAEKLKIIEKKRLTTLTLWLLEILENQNLNFNDENIKNQTQQIEAFICIPYVSNFLKSNKEDVYKILNYHGGPENVLELARLLNDNVKVFRYYLEIGRINDALNMLKNESFLSTNKDLLYLFISEFMLLAPKDTIDLLISFNERIESLAILPSLIFSSNNDAQISEVIRYLAFCIHSLHLPHASLHNYLIVLYLKFKPEKIMSYLATQGQDSSAVNYEIKFALKLCQEFGAVEACVQLFALLGLWERAVDLALTVSVKLAIQTAMQPPIRHTDLFKKLWLRIARHVVSENNDTKHVMEFLQQYNTIKIEDLLPFFDDFVTIDNFKDSVCSSLKNYNEDIELLKEDIEDVTNSASVIRSDIQSFKNSYTRKLRNMFLSNSNTINCKSLSFPFNDTRNIIHIFKTKRDREMHFTVFKEGIILERFLDNKSLDYLKEFSMVDETSEMQQNCLLSSFCYLEHEKDSSISLKYNFRLNFTIKILCRMLFKYGSSFNFECASYTRMKSSDCLNEYYYLVVEVLATYHSIVMHVFLKEKQGNIFVSQEFNLKRKIKPKELVEYNTVYLRNDTCSSCHLQLILRPFYVFPCSHYFHVDCLIKEVKPYVNENSMKQIENLQRQISEISSTSNDDDLANSHLMSLKTQLKEQLELLIASECFFCGSITIQLIDRPFYDEEEHEIIRKEWE